MLGKTAIPLPLIQQYLFFLGILFKKCVTLLSSNLVNHFFLKLLSKFFIWSRSAPNINSAKLRNLKQMGHDKISMSLKIWV